MTATNKQLLISDSHDDSNRCTPCRGKSDQHDTYAFHTSPCTPGVRFLRAVPIRGNLSRVINRVDRVTAPEKKGSRHNPQHVGWPIREFVPSFSPKPTNEAVAKAKTSINSRLLGLPDPYHRHAIDTFNTCSWGPTERSLIDTGRGYNLGGADLQCTHSLTFPTSCLPFPLVAPPGLQFN
jgi:hypothetical protein